MRGNPRAPGLSSHASAVLLPLSLVAAVILAGASADAQDDNEYGIHYRVSPDPAAGSARVRMSVEQANGLLREVRMRMPANRYSQLEADGQLINDGGRVVWHPPSSGGSLRWSVLIDNKRNETAFDARITDNWALFRASDIIPPAATRTKSQASSVTRLTFRLPAGWSAVTQYSDEDGVFRVRNEERRFDRPTGWILLGSIGTRKEQIAGREIVVTGPRGQGVRRMDTLAFLNWTLPEVTAVFDDFPDQFSVFSANDPMWRGGLSAPQSIYLHAERPLISENGTSTLLHEMVHVAIGLAAVPGADWIVEGLAEYYSLKFLRKSGTITETRYQTAIAKLEEWGRKADSLCAKSSTGAITARAAVIFSRLDREIRKSSSGAASLDDVAVALSQQSGKIDVKGLSSAVRDAAGRDLETLHGLTAADCAG